MIAAPEAAGTDRGICYPGISEHGGFSEVYNGLAEPADGPAFFIMIIMGIPAAGFGVWVEIMWEPSIWVHLLTSGPFMLLTCIPPIRFAKGMLVASQYVNKAEEVRFDTSAQTKDAPVTAMR